MRIIIAADTYYPNIDGASYFTQRLAEQLVYQGHRVMVIAPSQTLLTGCFKHKGVDVFGVSSPVGLFKKIKPMVLNFKPDVIHVQGHFFIEHAMIKIGKKYTIPIVATNHFMPDNLLHYLPLPKKINYLIKQLMWWHFKRVFFNLPIITTPTKTAANILRNIGITQKVVALSCGIDTTKFNNKNDSEYLRKRYHLPNKLILLAVNQGPGLLKSTH